LSVPGVGANSVRSLVDKVTIQPGARLMGRLNINTATAEALEDDAGLTEDVATQVVDRRQSQGDFTTVGDLLDVSQGAFRSLVDRVTTKSSVFIVRARGELDSGVYRDVEAWVRRENGQAHVTRWREMPRWPGWDGWGWTARGVLNTTGP